MSKLYFSKNETESFSTKRTSKYSHKLLVGTLALVLVAGMVSPAFALTIDNFEVGATNISADSGTPMASQSLGGLDANQVIQGDRFTKVTYQGGPLAVMADRVNLPPGVMAFSTDVGNTGLFELRYDAGGAGLGGIDLTANGGDRIIVDLRSADAGADVTVTIMDQSANTSDLSIMTVGGAEVLEFEFANFSAGADFTDVDKIEVALQGVIEGDYSIDLIGIPQTMVGGTVGSMSTATLLVAGAQANMGLWSLVLVGAVGAGAAIIYKTKSKKTEQ